jgi:hypothetical protein
MPKSPHTLFAKRSAAVLLNLPCGDGRNLPPLAAGGPILLAGDISQKAMLIVLLGFARPPD